MVSFVIIFRASEIVTRLEKTEKTIWPGETEKTLTNMVLHGSMDYPPQDSHVAGPRCSAVSF